MQLLSFQVILNEVEILRAKSNTYCDPVFFLIQFFLSSVLLNGVNNFPNARIHQSRFVFRGEQYIKRYLCIRFRFLSLLEHCLWKDLGPCRLEVFREVGSLKAGEEN